MVSKSMNPSDELLQIASNLDALVDRGQCEEIQRPLKQLAQAVEDVGKASSGSWLGYQANVYYKDLQPPPPGAHFSTEWGLSNSAFVRGSVGEWVEYDAEDVIAEIHRLAGDPDLKPAQAFNEEAITEFRAQRANLLSIIEIADSNSETQILNQLREAASSLSAWTESSVIRAIRPKGTKVSRDSTVLGQGFWVPPHFTVLSRITPILHTIEIIERLSEMTRQAASHISRQRQHSLQKSSGVRVFIGHGRSMVWLELKDFMENRLHLPTDEFNRVPVAGVSNKERLSEMLDEASIAFLIMTGEDEQPDGKNRARENVVHEVGLFQGKLGFQRAIVLLEEGCEEFSNITGLGQIRFPKGNIGAKFEDIRRVVEREFSS